ALAEDAPGLVADELPPDLLGVAHDVVGAEMPQVLRLHPPIAEARERLCGDRRRQPGAALVEEQHAIVLQRARQPPGGSGRTRRAKTGAALEEHEPGKIRVFLAGRHRLAREDADLARRQVVVERKVEPVLLEDEAGEAVRDFHRRDYTRP